VEFEAKEETLALLGASGCGKSMTLKCIAGIEKPDEGEIVLNNRVLFHSKKKINLLPQNRKVGLLFQSYALFPNMTLEENIAIGVPKNEISKKEIIKEKIKSFSLKGLENNYPHQLSGGQQQRVALARMLVNRPEILMLDEPFSALDEHLKWQMEGELISILKEHKGSTLYVSHNKDEVYKICDKIAVLNNGKIEEVNEKTNFFNRPQTFNSAILAGYKNISRAKKVDMNKIHAIDWDIQLECNELVKNNIKYVAIHEQNIRSSLNSRSINTFNFKIINRVENLLFYTLVLSRENTEGPSSYIYMNIRKEELYKYDFNSIDSLSIGLNKEDILLLY
jgi:molybdate transport system ATP-binding protein